MSEIVVRILEQLFNIQLTHRPSCKIRHKLCNFKDIRESSNQAAVVYKKMSCNDCDAVNIRETGRLLKERTQEHLKDVDKANVAWTEPIPSGSVYGTFLQFLGCQCCWKIK